MPDARRRLRGSAVWEYSTMEAVRKRSDRVRTSAASGFRSSRKTRLANRPAGWCIGRVSIVGVRGFRSCGIPQIQSGTPSCTPLAENSLANTNCGTAHPAGIRPRRSMLRFVPQGQVRTGVIADKPFSTDGCGSREAYRFFFEGRALRTVLFVFSTRSPNAARDHGS